MSVCSWLWVFRIHFNDVWRLAQPSGRAGSCFTDSSTAAHSEQGRTGYLLRHRGIRQSDRDSYWHNNICLRERHREVTDRLSDVFPMKKGFRTGTFGRHVAQAVGWSSAGIRGRLRSIPGYALSDLWWAKCRPQEVSDRVIRIGPVSPVLLRIC